MRYSDARLHSKFTLSTGRNILMVTDSNRLDSKELGSFIHQSYNARSTGIKTTRQPQSNQFPEMSANDLKSLTKKIIAFRDARDWEQFHNPKDLAAGLAIEASELQELFLWKKPGEIKDTVSNKRTQISEELADITWFLLLLSHEMDIDLLEAVNDKYEKNAAKYPVDKAKGTHTKYDEL